MVRQGYGIRRTQIPIRLARLLPTAANIQHPLFIKKEAKTENRNMLTRLISNIPYIQKNDKRKQKQVHTAITIQPTSLI